MNYTNSKFLQTSNMALEFLLLLAAYLLAGLCRSVLPFGSTFSQGDLWRFFPLSVLYALVMVSCYALEGCYLSLHRHSGVRELARLCVTDLIGFALMATLLYVFRLSQFSRLLLGMFYLFSVVLIFFKRLLTEKAADRYAKTHDTRARYLLLGSGPLAHRFYRQQQDGKLALAPMVYVGCLADRPDPALPDHLGGYDALHQVLAQHHVDRIVLAQETQSAHEVQRIMAVAAGFGIKVCAVPVYSDYVTARGAADAGGLRVTELSLLDTCNIMGVNIGVTDMAKTLTLIETQLENWRGKYICVANVHTTVTAHEDSAYRDIQNNAAIALPDGGPLSEYSRGHGFAGAQRVTGPDLMREVLSISAEKGWRHYFYGSTEQTLHDLQKKIEERYPGASIAGMYSPPFRDLTPQEDAEIVRKINEAKPDFVWVGLGAPKQERWMAAHEDAVQALMIGVGAAFDYEADNIKRAPMWMQRHSLEWLYRLMQDPKRLFKRYLTTNGKFLWWKWRH